jgi:predicted HicB family RNase H-like nuclease
MLSLLTYQGYFGSIDIRQEDACLYGKLEFISDLIIYEGESFAEINNAFQQAVDDYLATCKRSKKTPELPCKGTFNVRLGYDIHIRAAVAARTAGIKLNEFARQALEAKLSSVT